MIKITQKLIPAPSKRRSGDKIKGVKFIVAHDTGNDGSTALQNVNYFINSSNELSASAHTFIDDKDIIECVPLTEKAWHVRYNVPTDNTMFGVDSNDYAIGVELCYFSKDKERSLKAYNNYVEYIAQKTLEYNLNPKTKIVGHYTLDPGRKTDPINAFKTFNKTWEDFIKDLSEARIRLSEPVKHVETVVVPKQVELVKNDQICVDKKEVTDKVQKKEVLGLFALIKKLLGL